ncbi:MAG: SVM family protein ['Waltheria sp.' little leaf phytoplasma]|nr:SVM family protein ['Waltheria sp.' little leaf phytoplasma]
MLKLKTNLLFFKFVLFISLGFFLIISNNSVIAVNYENKSILYKMNTINFIEKQIIDFVENSKQKYPNLINNDIKNITKWIILNGDKEDKNQILLILLQIKQIQSNDSIKKLQNSLIKKIETNTNSLSNNRELVESFKK